MRILIVAIHYPVASGRYAKGAFQRLGHDVRSIGDSTGANIWGGQVDAKYAWQSDGPLTAHWDDWKPDLIVILESAWAYHHPVYSDVPHVVWGADNHVRDYRQAGIEHYFLMHKAVSLMEWQDDMTWLPACYDPTIHMPSPIAWQDREFDVAMIGVLYPQRVAVLDALAAAGLKVFAGTGLLGAEYAAAYHNARIALNVSAAGDLSQRIFETAAMGCAVLTDRLLDLDELKLSGKVWQYDSADEAVSVSQMILDDPTQVDEPGWVGGHTWDARAQYIVQWHKERYGLSGDQPDEEQGSRLGRPSQLWLR